MMDKNIRLFQAITDIDDAIIEEAQRNKTSQKNSKVFYTAVIAAAAAACVILVGVLLYSGAIGGGRGGSMAGGGEIPAGGGADIEERDYSPIAYKDLALPTANGIPGGADMTYGSGGASADITTFNESNLQEISCCGILEGKILQIYPKEYAVDFYDDKFGEVQLFHE